MAVTTSNGNGFALYNGVKLPDIDTVWTDKTAYPYAIITSFDAALVGYSGSSTIYLLDASGVAHYNNNGVCYKNPPYLSCSWFCSYDPDVCSYLSGMGLPITVGEWGGSSPSDIGSGSAQSVVGTVFWSNADILNTSNNSIFLAASDPIPLDGMNVIEWDGDTTGLVSSSGNTHYKVSDVVLSASDLVGSVIAFGSEAVVVPTEFITNGEGYASIDAYVLSCQNEGVSFFDNTFPEKGLYFINAFDVHLPFFAYPASGGGSGDDGGDDEGDTAPALKHYCCINGTVYEIKSGTAKMGGTFCEVKSGTVLIDGTVYDFALN